jgi:hypothetical protein
MDKKQALIPKCEVDLNPYSSMLCIEVVDSVPVNNPAAETAGYGFAN